MKSPKEIGLAVPTTARAVNDQAAFLLAVLVLLRKNKITKDLEIYPEFIKAGEPTNELLKALKASNPGFYEKLKALVVVDSEGFVASKLDEIHADLKILAGYLGDTTSLGWDPDDCPEGRGLASLIGI